MPFRLSLITCALLSAINTSQAADLTWTGPVGGDWSTPTNWDTGTSPVAGDNAQIISTDENNKRSAVADNTTIQADSVTLTGHSSLVLQNASSAGDVHYGLQGITHNTTNAGQPTNVLQFRDTSTAANAVISAVGNVSSTTPFDGSMVQFVENSTAGNAAIEAEGEAIINFAGSSSAGSSSITNNDRGMTLFSGNATTAGSATITNNNGGVTFIQGNMQADDATIVNNAGGELNLGNNRVIHVGSVSGAGDIWLSNSQLQVGAKNLDDVISGQIHDDKSAAAKAFLAYLLGNTPAPTTGGSLVKTGTGTLTLTGNNTYTGGTQVAQGTLQINPSAAGSQENLGTGAVNISSGATLSAHTDGAFTFANALTGDGLLSASNNGNTFTFTSAAGSVFQGTVALADNTFTLSGDNTTALGQATLRSDTGNVTTVGDGNQRIGGLAFNGGKAIFNASVPGDKAAASTITADNLDISGAGTVQVGVPDSFNNTQPLPDTRASLLEQDDQNTLVQLVSATNVTGTGGSLNLTDQNGNAISASRTLDITQDGTTVAEGTYDFGLTAGASSDGLYVNYGLQQVNLLGTGAQALALTPGSGATGQATDLSAKVIGTGDLAIAAGSDQQVSLSNGDNSYSGVTDVRSGTLLMQNNNVLGQTSALNLASGTVANMNGFGQSVGELNTAAGSQIIISGNLTITDSQRAAGATRGGAVEAGTLAGNGSLTVDPSTLLVNGDQSSYSGRVTVTGGSALKLNSASAFNSAQGINLATAADTLTFGALSSENASWTAQPVGTASVALSGTGKVRTQNGADVALAGNNSGFSGQFLTEDGSVLRATQAQNLGTATVAADGTLALANTTDWILANTITGDGTVQKSASGTLSTGSSLSGFTGNTNVESGALVVGETGSESSTLGGNVTVASNGILSGTGTVAGSVDNTGTIAAFNALPGLNGYGNGTVASNLTLGTLNNSGTVQLAGAAPGNTLTVAGDYAGNDGTLKLNTALGGDSSLTDKLVVKGGTSGTTNVTVNNAGGSGAKTIDGIEVVKVGGTSAGNFVQSGRIVAGAYDYSLKRGEGVNNKNWYLTSAANTGNPGTPGKPGLQAYRPETGSYIANLAAANTLFNTRLHDRLGETQYTDLLTGEQKVTSLWMRHVGGHTRFESTDSQQKTQNNRYVLQMGGDIAQWSTNGLDRWHLGVMAGYGNSQSNTQSKTTGYHSRGQINGYSAGVYGTWYANDADKTGTYLDSWVLYNWFKNQVSGQGLGTERYDSDGITASVESGYTFLLGDSADKRSSYWLQPKAQVTWMDVEADNHTEFNGTRVQDNGDGNLQTRLGVKAFIKGHSAIDDGKTREFQPFIEANWIYNSRTYGVTMNGMANSQDGARNIGELKAGVEGQVDRNLQVWGNVAQQMGGKGYSDTQGMLGIKYAF